MPRLDKLFEDNLTDIASFNPELRLYLDQDSREFVEDQLGDVRMMLYEWEGDMVNHRVVDIIRLALSKGQDWVVYRIMNYLSFNNKLLNTIIVNRAYIHHRKEVIDFMTKNGYDDLKAIVYAAAEIGDIKIFRNPKYVELPVNWRIVACNAAKNGNSDIVDYAVEVLRDSGSLKVKRIEAIACSAALGGYIDIVEAMIRLGELGYGQLEYIAGFAAKGGYIDIMEEMIKRRTVECIWSPILEGVAETGNRNKLMEVLDRADKDDYLIDNYLLDAIAESAAKNGHIDIVEDMLLGFENLDGELYKADNLNMIAKSAASGGHIAIVDYMIELGSDLKGIAEVAAKNGYKLIVREMEERGVDVSELNFREHEDAKIYFSY